MVELADLIQTMGVENTKFYGEGRLPLLSKFAQELDLLSWEQPIIAVTGTNGKGSTVKALASIYQAAGYRAGVFTSPHLYRVNERIALNDENISDADLLFSLQHILSFPATSEFSFFELMTLAALDFFKRSAVDVLILEVGVGGRLDAINILDADVVVMTSIDLDHQSILGSSIEAIAKEKAGLLRPKASLVFADRFCPPIILELAQEQAQAFFCLGQDYTIQPAQAGWCLGFGKEMFVFAQNPKLDIQAMAAAMMVSWLLKNRLPLTQFAWEEANRTARIPGRIERIEGEPTIILDVAHNPHATRRLYRYLSELNISGKIHVVFSILHDKDGLEVVKIINNLSPLWYNCLLSSERSHTRASLADLFTGLEPKPYFDPEPLQAFKQAKMNAKADDVIVVFGSFLLVGQVGQYLQQEGSYVV